MLLDWRLWVQDCFLLNRNAIKRIVQGVIQNRIYFFLCVAQLRLEALLSGTLNAQLRRLLLVLIRGHLYGSNLALDAPEVLVLA